MPKFNGRTGVLPPLDDEKNSTRFRSLDDRRSADPTLINHSQSPMMVEDGREINHAKVDEGDDSKAKTIEEDPEEVLQKSPEK